MALSAPVTAVGTTKNPAGIARQPWFSSWLAAQGELQRSYHDDVVRKLEVLKVDFVVESYGALSYDPLRYPLLVVKSRDWNLTKPTVLVTGGVIGCETSTIEGCIAFLESRARSYCETFNLVVVPCVSPWCYETFKSWNPLSVDPNLSFRMNGPAEESAKLMALVASLGVEKWCCHIDLHESMDCDASTRIPNTGNGFYLVDDQAKPNPDWLSAIASGLQVASGMMSLQDPNTSFCDSPVHLDAKSLGLCIAATNAPFAACTAVQAESHLAATGQLRHAQSGAVVAALDHLVDVLGMKAV